MYDSTADRLFEDASLRITAGDVQAPVIKSEHLIAMKVQAIKNAPRRVSIDVPDIEFLLTLPGIEMRYGTTLNARGCCESTMASANLFEGLDFERDMPLTEADLEALARARHLRPLSTEAYLDWLTLMWRKDPSREIVIFDEPFTL